MAKKEVAKTKSSNKTDELDAMDTFICDMPINLKAKESEREKKLRHYLAFGLKPYSAALRAGYSVSYAKKQIYRRLRKDEELQSNVAATRAKIRERYLDFATDALPEIAWVEKRILSKLAANPDGITPTTAKVMRDLKKSAKVLSDDHPQIELIPVQVALQIQAIVQSQQEQPHKVTVVDVEDD